MIPLVYDELRELAERWLRVERPGHTLLATALVHEAYLRLVGGSARTWENRTHFFATAALSIRRILVEHARRRGRLKRGGHLDRVGLRDADLPFEPDEFDDERLLMLDAALDRLGVIDPRKARVVERRFFAGLTVEEAAAAMNTSASTVARDWRLARAWLRCELEGTRNGGA